jgi:hypothetical protein
VTRVLPEDGAVCAETRRRDLMEMMIMMMMMMMIIIIIYSTVCVHLVGILKT